MAVTHFQITKLPDGRYVKAFMGDDALVKDELYPIARQSELFFERAAYLLGYYAKENFTYKTYDEVNDLYSNEAISTVEWKSSLEPLSEYKMISFLEAKNNNLLSLLPINAGVEFLELIEITNNQGISLNNQSKGKIEQGMRLTIAELHSTWIDVRNLDMGSHIDQQLTIDIFYSVGKGSRVAPYVYMLSINIS